MIGARRLLWFALVVGLGLRLYGAVFFRGNYDQESYRIVARLLERGGDIYTETDRYNYTPVWAWCLVALHRLSAALDVELRIVVRTFLALVDLANAAFLGLIASRSAADPGSGERAAAAYLLNPVAFLIVGFHGQFDVFAALPLLAALWLLVRAPAEPPVLAVWALGTLSILIKHLQVFSVWMLFVYAARGRRKAVALFAGALAAFAASFLPYLPASLDGIRANVLGYRGFTKIWGFGMLLPGYLSEPLFVAAMLALPFAAFFWLRLSPPRGLELASAGLMTFIHGISEQYFVVPAIFGSVARPWAYWLYTAAATVFLVASPHNVYLVAWPTIWNLVWLAAAAWVASFFLMPRRAPA
jgi:hypothetical protein